MKQPTTISSQEIKNDAAYRLDMTILKGKGVLRRPLKELLKVVLHRLGVVYSLEAVGEKWKAHGKIRKAGRTLALPPSLHDTKEQAEDEFFFAVSGTLPQKILSALVRD
ncbi:hypothetical protein [Rhizobium sp. Rhizsp82]|uniref:hypothetical protein n=1 Tax=Rhizobium sp. Rhizsp82 TaxID=3243057 RepID=UPI0039B6012F